MRKNNIYLILQTILYVLLTILLCAAAIRIYREGTAVRESGDVLAWIYTKERIWRYFRPIIPVILVAFVMLIIGIVFRIRNPKQNAPVSSGKAEVISQNEVSSAASEKHVTIIRVIIAAAAVLLIILGIFNGSMRDVLVKAINLCTECIGLG